MSDKHQVLFEIASQAQAVVQAETAVVAIAENQGETVYYAAAVGKHASVILDRRAAAATSGLCGVTFQAARPVLVCQTQGDQRVRQDQAQALGIKTALAVPLQHQEQLLGALMVLNRVDGHSFNADDQHLLEQYAQKAAPVLQKYLAYK